MNAAALHIPKLSHFTVNLEPKKLTQQMATCFEGHLPDALHLYGKLYEYRDFMATLSKLSIAQTLAATAFHGVEPALVSGQAAGAITVASVAMLSVAQVAAKFMRNMMHTTETKFTQFFHGAAR